MIMKQVHSIGIILLIQAARNSSSVLAILKKGFGNWPAVIFIIITVCKADQGDNKQQSLNIPLYMEARVRATEYPNLSNILFHALYHVLWNLPQQVAEATSIGLFSRAGMPGPGLLSHFFGRGVDALADSFRWSGQELMNGVIFNNIDLLLLIPAMMLAPRHSGISRFLMQQIRIKPFLMLGYQLYEPLNHVFSGLKSANAYAAAKPEHRIELADQKLDGLIEIIWRKHPGRFYGGEFKISLHPEHADCTPPRYNSEPLSLAARIEQLACEWPSDDVYILSYIQQLEEQFVRVFQPCSGAKCGKLYARNKPLKEQESFCWLEQLFLKLPKGLDERTTSMDSVSNHSVQYTFANKLSGYRVDPSPIDYHSLTLIQTLVQDLTSPIQSIPEKNPPSLLLMPEPSSSSSLAYPELIDSLTKIQIDNDSALIMDISDPLFPRTTLFTDSPPDLSEYLQYFVNHWGGTRLYSTQIQANVAKVSATLFQFALTSFLTQQSSRMIDASVSMSADYLKKTPVSLGGGTDKKSGRNGNKPDSNAYNSATGDSLSSPPKVNSGQNRPSSKNGDEGRQPESEHLASPGKVFEPKCEKCLQALTEEDVFMGILVCDNCKDNTKTAELKTHNGILVATGKTSDTDDSEDMDTAATYFTYNIPSDADHENGSGDETDTSCDSDSSSGSGSSTSSDSESESDEDSWYIMEPVEEPGRRYTYRQVRAKQGEDGIVLLRKRRINLWDRHGYKKPARRLRKPYPVHQYTETEPYTADPASIMASPFPPLNRALLYDTAALLECAKCSRTIPVDQQFEHNRAHLHDFLANHDESYSNTCPWCNEVTPVMTIGYHLRKQHPELVFGSNERASRLEAIDLFCGIGGLSLGLKKAGLEIIAGFDIDKTCGQSYQLNHDALFIERDIFELKNQKLKEMKQLFSPGSIQVIAAGVPCVTFSALSKKRHSEEAKFGTLMEFGRVIKKLKPEIFVMENVPYIACRSSTGYHRFIRKMQQQGYYLSQKVLLASEYGSPQHRKRLILLASRYGYIQHPEPLNSIDEAATLRDAIGYLPKISIGKQHALDPMHVTAKLCDDTVEAIRYSPVGYRSGHLQWPAKVRKQKADDTDTRDQQNWRMWRHNLYGRMEYDEPACTITTNAYHPSGGSYTHPDPEQQRGLSVRELMNIQGFPKNMMLEYANTPGKNTRQRYNLPENLAARHVGNAVPPPLAEAIGKAIIRHEEQLKKPLPNSYFFPRSGMKYRFAKNDAGEQSRSYTGRLGSLKLFRADTKRGRVLYVDFIHSKTGVSPETDPDIKKPKLVYPTELTYLEEAMPSYSDWLRNCPKINSGFYIRLTSPSRAMASVNREVILGQILSKNLARRAFIPYGAVLMTVPEETTYQYPEAFINVIDQFSIKLVPEETVRQGDIRTVAGVKRKLPPVTDDNAVKKRKQAGMAGFRGFKCPVEGCLSPDGTGQYSLTNCGNWFDHLIGRHGQGYPYNNKRFNKIIHMGEAIVASKCLLKCKIESCMNIHTSYSDLAELGKHIKTHHEQLDSLESNDLWKKNSLKVKPISSLDNHHAGKRYQTRFGLGFVCPDHPQEQLTQTPEAFAVHWYFAHMGLKYFCPFKQCANDGVAFDKPSALYQHMRSHGLIKPEDLSFTQLNACE